MPLARDGTTFSLWNDVRNNFLPKVEFSHLFSFAKKMDCLTSTEKIYTGGRKPIFSGVYRNRQC
jgi:hypothetical protein